MMKTIQNQHVLIAGGSGLIGTHLSKMLLEEGFKVSFLGRRAGIKNDIKTYLWDPEKNYVDKDAFSGITHIVSLAGEPIAAKRWSNQYKQKIIHSRLCASAIILNALQTIPNEVKTLVAASAIGIYGNRGDELLTENSLPGIGFLPYTVSLWESSYKNSPVRTVLLRIGIVLAKDGGALPELTFPLKFFVAPTLGTGKQFMSWIHIDDLCGMILHSLKVESCVGVYNAVSQNPVQQKTFNSIIKSVLNKSAFQIKIPAFFLRLFLGEKFVIILDSAKVSSSKIADSGYTCRYATLQKALMNIYAR